MFRAASSAGANYEEARGAESRSDFVHKIRVACKEVRESRHWLRIVAGAEWVANLEELLDEGWQLIAILEASAKTARSS